MISRKIIFITALAVLPIGAYAATDTSAKSQATFSSLDMNKDGYISRAEANADKNLSSNWDAADRNQNGILEEAEFSAFEEQMAPEADSKLESESEKEVE